MKTDQKVSHTPGPWKIKGDPITEDISIRSNGVEEEHLIASMVTRQHVFMVTNTKEERQSRIQENLANARLIAAATELLEICKLAVRWGNLPGDIHGAMKDIIAKAEGR